MRWTVLLSAALVVLVATVAAVATPALVDAAVTPAEQTAMLAAHNKLRREVAAAETQRLGRTVAIPDLAWDTAAAASAQAWADYLIVVGTLDHNTARGAYGENLATFENAAPFPNPNPTGVETAFAGWKVEAGSYNWDTNTCAGECGHYKQLVWASATGVGCGVATGPGVLIPGGYRTVWACYYSVAATDARPYEPAGSATATPTATGTPTASATPGAAGGYSGTAPARGQVGLLVTSRASTPAGLSAALEVGGCTAATIAVLEGGQWRVYVVGAPPFVNATFPASLPQGTPFFVRCQA